MLKNLNVILKAMENHTRFLIGEISKSYLHLGKSERVQGGGRQREAQSEGREMYQLAITA